MQQIIVKKYKTLQPEVYDTLRTNPIDGIPAIVNFFYDGREWIVEEELILGSTLYEILSDGLFEPKRAAEVGISLCNILEKLHRLGIIHGDLKPENIIITDDNKVYLIDYNASHIEKKGNGRDTVLLGTPGFASPEQFGFVRSDRRADVYAMGQLLNMMITGKFTQSEIPKGPIGRIIKTCVKMKPQDRYQTISSLKADLKKYGNRKVPYLRFMPPGFRSLCPWKMVLGAIGYAAIIGFLASLHYEEKDNVAGYEIWLWRGIIFLYVYGIILICSNYLDVNYIFKFARKGAGFRILSKIIEIIIYQFIVLILIIIASFVLQSIFPM